MQAARTEHHKLGGLNYTEFFFSVMEAGKSQVKVLGDLVSGESLFPHS